MEGSVRVGFLKIQDFFYIQNMHGPYLVFQNEITIPLTRPYPYRIHEDPFITLEQYAAESQRH